MAKMNTSHRYVYDAAPATLFKARTAVAITATANSDEVDLDRLDGYWNGATDLADETVAAVVNVVGRDAGTGDETYTMALKATDGSGNVLTAAALGTLTITGIGQYIFLVDIASLKKAAPTAAGLVLTATLAGTTPILTYHAWLAQIKKA